MAVFPSDEWIELYVVRINASNEYRDAAADWEGDVAFVFEAEPDKNVPSDTWAWLQREDQWTEEEGAARDHERQGEEAAEAIADQRVRAVDPEILRRPAFLDSS